MTHKKTYRAGGDPVQSRLSRRVKELRAAHGWSLDALSAACGVSRSMLSQIERNQVNPTVAVTFRIAEAFGISLGELFESPDVISVIDVVRANDLSHLYRSDESCRIRTLSPLHLLREVEFYELQLAPDGALHSSPHFKNTREFVTVQKGRVRVESSRDSVELRRGDTASYPADVRHAIVNIGRGEAVLYLVVISR